jgi:hypothetical protein
MARVSKAKDLARLREIADELENLDGLYNERVLIWKRRADAGDTLSDLAVISRCARAQVSKALLSNRVTEAKAGKRRRRPVVKRGVLYMPDGSSYS